MRDTCVATKLSTGSTAYIPLAAHEGEVCGAPAVDYQERDGIRYPLCSKHWDIAKAHVSRYRTVGLECKSLIVD